MTDYGFALSSEEHGPKDLVAAGRRAEEVGFTFVSISDHYHPWITNQGHSPFVWSVIGAVAAATDNLTVGVGVTCPTMRIHPAILAQATATSSLLLDGKFVFGVGTGENLNEHILGQRWPTPEVRLEMLEEAVDIIRRLWSGDTVDHHGTHYTVENARLFDPPKHDTPIVVSAFGEKSTKLAADIGDGLWNTSPLPEAVEQYRSAGGSGPVWGQLTLCWAESEDDARKTVLKQWPNTALPGSLAQELPTWTHFEQATDLVDEDAVAGAMPMGPDPEPVLDKLRSFEEAGFTHIYFHQVGDDQEGFFRFWERELKPRLR